MRLIVDGPPKFCPECGFKRPRSDFYVFRLPGGRTRVSTLCVEHEKQRCGRWQRANPEAMREKQRRQRQAIKADPERWAVQRDMNNQWRRRKLGITPDRYRTPRPFAHALGRRALYPQPFAWWLRRLASSPTRIAEIAGLDEAQVRKYLAGTRMVSESTVDRVLCRVNTDTTLRDLYPELYELGEADGHCAVGHPQGDSSSLAPRRSPTARSTQRSEQEAA